MNILVIALELFGFVVAASFALPWAVVQAVQTRTYVLVEVVAARSFAISSRRGGRHAKTIIQRLDAGSTDIVAENAVLDIKATTL